MNRIKELRKNKKLTLIELGQKLNLPKGTLSRYENGIREPKKEMWQKIAKFFDVPVLYLKGYMVCTKCKSAFLMEPKYCREDIKCCPYCMNTHFMGDRC